VICTERKRERGGDDGANQCSGQNVAIGGWCSEKAEGGLGRKDVPAPPALASFIFLRSAATLSLSPDDCSSRRTKEEMRKCAETLTSLFRNALISVDRVAPERERDIESTSRRDAIMRVTETAPNARHVHREVVADARNTKSALGPADERKKRIAKNDCFYITLTLK